MKPQALASKPQVLENCPVLGSRTALFFELLKFFEHLFFLISPENFTFWRTLAPVSLVLDLVLEHSCPCPREGLSLEELPLASDFFVSLAEASSLVSSTAPLIMAVVKIDYNCDRAVPGEPRGYQVKQLL